MRLIVTAAAFILISLIGMIFSIAKLVKNRDDPKKTTMAYFGVLFFGTTIGVVCGLILPQ